MVVELVKQAVHLKLTSKNESPLISPSEFAYAAACALAKSGADPDIVQKAGEQISIADMKAVAYPVFDKMQQDYGKDPQMSRLLRLLLSCKVNGKITEEIRVLYETGRKVLF